MRSMDDWIGAIRYYTLEGTTPVLCPESTAFWAWLETADRHVADTTLPDGTRISTVFTGICTTPPGDPYPQLFESMVFGAGDGAESRRARGYATWEDAERGHAALVAEAMAQQVPVP